MGKEFGAVPCGLGARNTLRLEGKLPLYGHEISDTINVWEAGLDRFCKVEKPEFIGREALENGRAGKVERTLVGLEMVDRGIARHGYPVLRGGEQVGVVTSGTQTPFLKKAIGMVYLPIEHTAPGVEFDVDIRGRRARARVVPMPFYKRPRG